MTRADWVLLLCLLAVQPWLYWHYWRDSGAADSAVISAQEQSPLRVSLRHDRLLTVHGPLGASELEIKAGRIRFLASPCQGKQCLHSGWLSRAGDFAACLPNRVSVTLLGNGAGYDAISY